MPILAQLSALILIVSIAFGQAPVTVKPRVLAFEHGNVFDGEKFTERDLYVVDGVLAAGRPARIDTVIDLRGTYVVPPYADAHNHNIDGFKKVDERIQRDLTEGIFYVKNPNSIQRYTRTLEGKINIPTSVDVMFSNGGLTASGGHPLELVRRNIGLGIFSRADAEGGMYYILDTRADLDKKWATIIADRPDFIKTYLLYSEEFLQRRDDTTYFGWKGLDPALLPEIVRRAHHDELRVSTHIETATDFHHAVQAGVDEINHMPGFRADSTGDYSRFEIRDEDAREAGAKGIVVVTTLAGSTDRSAAYQGRLDRLHRRNLTLLKTHRVRIAIGSDEYRQTSVREALYLHRLQVFGDADLLAIWCDNTAAAIYPRRNIGRLLEGYEASFLVLKGDPLADFANTGRILLRVKQGIILSPSP